MNFTEKTYNETPLDLYQKILPRPSKKMLIPFYKESLVFKSARSSFPEGERNIDK
jgi:hypothetical protein